MRDKLRKERGVPIYVYDAKDFTLLYIFESKQQMYSLIKIHHNSLNACLATGILYVDTFFFSLDLIEESASTNLLSPSPIFFFLPQEVK
ncbi:NUMOD1 domain-containing DNA-binding protein [Actinomadura sp. RB99]|uniref:NUMOD1 domain-containing DNA-binding protein n=1 Tax=Actinomadura sp. RB99 TaxID=2691577 RepID=UPI0016899ACE|nr:NUMOD1 domain-containing DNA-binding protein [Actinomadura sp. RB99]